MSETDGASPREQILGACRTDNLELYHEVKKSLSGESKEDVAKFYNEIVDSMGNHLLHICAAYGSYDVMNELLDVEFLECDPLNRRDKDTPIHSAVRYATEKDAALGQAMVEMLIDAGGDPRTRNGANNTPMDLCDKKNEELVQVIRQGIYILNEGLQNGHAADDDDDHDGPASDSD